MQVHVFLAPGWQGFTTDPTGANLPYKGNWRNFKIINLNRGEAPRVPVDVEAALQALETDGYFVQAVKAR